jgi:hypothetical protein
MITLQSSSGAASTTEKLMKETDIKVTQVQADVKAKKAQVSSAHYVCTASNTCWPTILTRTC